jgi:hypothetical protein
MKVDGVLDGVACGSMNVGNNGTIFAKQSVEKGGLSYVCLADDGYGDTLLQSLSRFERVGETCDVLVNVYRQRLEFATVGKLQVFMV